MKFKFLVGCYTDAESQNGLHLLSFDAATRKIELISSHAINNASYLVASPTLPVLYTVNENHTEADRLSAVAFDDQSNAFKTINDINAHGADPCFITIDRAGKFVFSANYSDGSLSCAPVNSDGSLGKLAQLIKHAVDPSDELHPNSHLHAVVFSPDEKFLFATNLGQDTLTVYSFEQSEKNKPLTEVPHQVFQFPAGTGPRHLIFDQNGRYIYVVGELNGTIQVLEWQNETLSFVENQPLMPIDFIGKNSAADLHLDATGKFLYVSNRGDANQLIRFTINLKTGQAILAQRISSGGIGPRNFAIDPLGRFILVANQNSNNLTVLEIGRTGKLTETGISYALDSPVFIMFQT